MWGKGERFDQINRIIRPKSKSSSGLIRSFIMPDSAQNSVQHEDILMVCIVTTKLYQTEMKTCTNIFQYFKMLNYLRNGISPKTVLLMVKNKDKHSLQLN